MKHFARTGFAIQLADAMQGVSLFGDAPNGLFLAAPRRTGKSTFLQSDLVPELVRRGIEVVYVDLWTNTKADPAALIAEVIGRAIDRNRGVLSKLALDGGVDSISAPWFKLDLTKIGKLHGTTLADALRLLGEMTKRPVALIIDEAQHALTSEDGEATMTALKAARDQLNAPGTVKLMLVMTGSDRDKLLRLVNANNAPFFGSNVQKMQTLGKDFVDFVVDLIHRDRPDLKPVDAVLLTDAFMLFGARPQFFSDALAKALSPLEEGSDRFEREVVKAAEQKRLDDEAQMESEFLSLKPIEQAVLWRMLEQGNRFRPYDAEALRFYREKVKQFGGRATVSAQSAQGALESIRSRSPALAWKSARGEYALDDAMMQAWYEGKVKTRTWPPRASEGDRISDEGEGGSETPD